MDNIISILNNVHNDVPMEEQFRRASLFGCALAEAGFSPVRIRELRKWISDNPSGIGSIFMSWANVYLRGPLKDEEVENWYRVAQFLAEGGEVHASPYELALADQVKNRFLAQKLNAIYQSC